jgi:hypothetical protein
MPLTSYVGTWQSTVSGLTMVILPNRVAVLSWLGNAVWAKFMPRSGKLDGVVTGIYPKGLRFVYLKALRFHVGDRLSLSPSRGGILLNSYGIVDDTVLFRQPQQPLSAYAHQWHVHGSQLTISGTTGTMTWNNGPCGQAMCAGHATVALAPGQVGINAKVYKTWFTQWNGGPPPPEYRPPASIHAGDQFVLAYVNRHVAIEIWVGAAGSLNGGYGNPYWCHMDYINPRVCGA